MRKPILLFVLTLLGRGGLATSAEELPALGGSCVSSFDCVTASAPVCDGGVCVAGPNGCTGDDVGDDGFGDDGPALARNFGTPPTFDAAICNAPASEADYYAATITDSGRSLTLTLSWTGGADLDLHVFDFNGRLHGFSLHRNPEQVNLPLLLAGPYFARVRRTGATAQSVAVPYTLTATIGPEGIFCKIDGDCAGLSTLTGLYRSNCLWGCAFDDVTAAPLGERCDSDANCLSGRCSYVPFETDRGTSVCTTTCSSDADCSSLPEAPRCSLGRSPNLCLPPCVTDTDCGADPRTKLPDPGLPWDFLRCVPESGRCVSWIFKDGLEGGDPAMWPTSAP